MVTPPPVLSLIRRPAARQRRRATATGKSWARTSIGPGSWAQDTFGILPSSLKRRDMRRSKRKSCPPCQPATTTCGWVVEALADPNPVHQSASSLIDPASRNCSPPGPAKHRVGHGPTFAEAIGRLQLWLGSGRRWSTPRTLRRAPPFKLVERKLSTDGSDPGDARALSSNRFEAGGFAASSGIAGVRTDSNLP